MSISTPKVLEGPELAGNQVGGLADPRSGPLWYVVRTRSRHEKTVRDQLARNEVEETACGSSPWSVSPTSSAPLADPSRCRTPRSRRSSGARGPRGSTTRTRPAPKAWPSGGKHVRSLPPALPQGAARTATATAAYAGDT